VPESARTKSSGLIEPELAQIVVTEKFYQHTKRSRSEAVIVQKIIAETGASRNFINGKNN
jgi:hypothetical protein